MRSNAERGISLIPRQTRQIRRPLARFSDDADFDDGDDGIDAEHANTEPAADVVAYVDGVAVDNSQHYGDVEEPPNQMD